MWECDTVPETSSNDCPRQARRARYAQLVRLGVIDIGSNTVHVLIADMHPGGRPLATTSDRSVVRLMRYLDADGSISGEGVDAILAAVRRAWQVAQEDTVDEVLVTATSAVREATNGPETIAKIEAVTGQPLDVLDGATEARLTFLAARRWFGWQAGQIVLFDIGGGSLELAAGAEETPDIAVSLPLGAGRMTLAYLPGDPPEPGDVDALTRHAVESLESARHAFADEPPADIAVGSSKAIRSLARLCGYSVTDRGGSSRYRLPREDLQSWIPRLAKLPSEARQVLPGITPDRAPQIVAAAIVVNEAMRALGVEELEASPWALREGVLLRYIESMQWR